MLVPVKPTLVAKSRLSTLGDEVRRDLVRALAADTIAAALSSDRVECVLAVTDDHLLAAYLRGTGADVLPDGASELNRSLVEGAAELRRRHGGMAVAALCADLPALRPCELTAALEVASTHAGAFVSDQEGSGTTMVTASRGHRFHPRFGEQSRVAHVAAGLHEIVEVDVPTLRRDVDTPADLAAALSMGVGERTTSVASGLRL